MNDEINAPPKFELNIYKCGLCDNFFSNLEDLNGHISNGLDFCSGFEKLEPKDDEKDHPQIEMKLECNIVCDICLDKFNDNQEYENHYKLHQEAILKLTTKKKSPKNHFLRHEENLPDVWSEIQKIKNEKIAEDVSLPYSNARKFYKQSYYKGTMSPDLLGVSRAEINLENNTHPSHSELKFPKKSIFKSTKSTFLTFSRVQKHIFYYFKNGKKSIFALKKV